MEDSVQQKPKVQIIIGSTRPGRVGKSIGDWFLEESKRLSDKADFELIDLANWDLPFLDEPIPAKAGVYQHAHTKRWSEKIKEGSAYILITPEYNHGYPAVLKNALDYLYHEWSNKRVGIVSYGFQTGGKTAAKQLLQVAKELGMQPVAKELNIYISRTDNYLAQYNEEVQTLINELILV